MAISGDLLPALFREPDTPTTTDFSTPCQLIGFGFAISDPTDTTDSNKRTSEAFNGHLVQVVVSVDHFWLSDHAICMAAGESLSQDRKEEAVTTCLY